MTNVYRLGAMAVRKLGYSMRPAGMSFDQRVKLVMSKCSCYHETGGDPDCKLSTNLAARNNLAGKALRAVAVQALQYWETRWPDHLITSQLKMLLFFPNIKLHQSPGGNLGTRARNAFERRFGTRRDDDNEIPHMEEAKHEN